MLGAALGIEILPQEARPIGRKVDYYGGEEKKATEKAKASLKDKKKAAKTAAGKAADLAAGLDEKLTSLEADAATSREMRRTRAIGREL